MGFLAASPVNDCLRTVEGQIENKSGQAWWTLGSDPSPAVHLQPRKVLSPKKQSEKVLGVEHQALGHFASYNSIIIKA